jgi:two-component system, NarL family, sensor histidine kinase LiaS
VKRLRQWFQSVYVRLLVSHVLVTALTSILILIVIFILIVLDLGTANPDDYAGYASDAAVEWLTGGEDARPNNSEFDLPGYSLVVSPDQRILFTQGDAMGCKTGMMLTECAPDLVDLPAGARSLEINDEAWVEAVVDLSSGDRAITYRRPYESLQLALWYTTGSSGADIYAPDLVQVVLLTALTAALVSFPAALFLVWLFVRPLVRRISRIAGVSRQFADGNLGVRVKDAHSDEIGLMSQQFDSMADALQQNVHVLRDMAQHNTTLAQQAEQSAIQAERLRLSRDLHDSIAQRLFSLTVSTSTLPDMIAQSQERGTQQARQIAQLAEQALLDLRTLLIDLRPATIIENGLNGALQQLCDQWQQAHHAPVELSLILSGRHLSASIESTLYIITQEALNNVAKHARATQVAVSIIEGQRQLTLSVTDNGQGMPVNRDDGQGHFGLITMRERTAALGGSFSLESDAGSGTTIRVTLPLRHAQEG